MFDFEKLSVYTKAKAFRKIIFRWLKDHPALDAVIRDQLKRASLSVPLNIAEGVGRFSRKDRRNFYVIARSSIFEVVAILDILREEEVLDPAQFDTCYLQADELSRMLYSMIQKLKTKEE